jgi:MFS family permease
VNHSLARRVLIARGLRAFADGYIALLMPLYLLSLGMSTLQVGTVTAATMCGSALLTLGVGLHGWRFGLHALLMGAALLMTGTGIFFATLTGYWPLLVVAAIGTLNASADDASVFLTLEHSLLGHATDSEERTAVFARYSLVGALMGATGALAASLPAVLAQALGTSLVPVMRVSFLGYALIGIAMAVVYRHLPVQRTAHSTVQRAALTPSSRGIVIRLAGLFSLDAFGGGLVIQSMLVLWLHLHFDLSPTETARVFFCTGLLSAASFFFVAPLVRRLGLLPTMVLTHAPASFLLILIPLMPSAGWAIALILLRAAIASLDVPARSAFVMSVVSPAERPAAASFTSVPRSLMWAAGPLLAGYLLGVSTFGWPLMIAGVLKLVYDALLFARFHGTPLRVEPVDSVE